RLDEVFQRILNVEDRETKVAAGLRGFHRLTLEVGFGSQRPREDGNGLRVEVDERGDDVLIGTLRHARGSGPHLDTHRVGRRGQSCRGYELRDTFSDLAWSELQHARKQQQAGECGAAIEQQPRTANYIADVDQRGCAVGVTIETTNERR